MMTLLPEKRRLHKRFEKLPTVTHNCQTYGIWVRRNGKLVCRICSKP